MLVGNTVCTIRYPYPLHTRYYTGNLCVIASRYDIKCLLQRIGIGRHKVDGKNTAPHISTFKYHWCLLASVPEVQGDELPIVLLQPPPQPSSDRGLVQVNLGEVVAWLSKLEHPGRDGLVS